jgi:hypothetical protein
MHSAIFVATVPANDMQWKTFLGLVDRKIGTARNAELLGEGVWLVNVRESFAPLGHLVALAENQSIVCRILALALAPEWLPGASYPKTIPAQS